MVYKALGDVASPSQTSVPPTYAPAIAFVLLQHTNPMPPAAFALATPSACHMAV